jgi:PAS domain S-box-containing protein
LEDRSFVVLTDVTAQKRAEESLRAEKQKLETVCENLPLGMVLIGGDENPYLKYVNPKSKELFGYAPDDVPEINEWAAAVYQESGLPRDVMPTWINVLKKMEPEAAKPRVRKVKAKDGKEKYIKFIPIQLETGDILMTCEDVTVSKQAREILQERNLELEALNDLIAPVSTSLHLPQLLNNMKRIFVEKLKISAGGIFLNENQSNKFKLEMLWGVPDSTRSEFEAFALRCYTDGIPVHEGDGMLVRSRLSLSSASLLDRFQHQEWKGCLCISLPEEGEIQGMVFLVDKDYERFGDDQVAFYRAVGEQIAVATQNARLFEQVQQSEIQMKALSLRLVDVQEAERRFVARELHDEVGQVLTGLNLVLEMHTQELGREPTARLLEARSTVNELVDSVRELSLRLRPSMLDDLGLLPTLRWYFERFYNKTNICVLFECARVDNKRFAAEVETAAYRIVQEASTNVARHAKVNEVAVRVWCEDKAIKVQIEDHGVGFDSESILQAGSAGGLSGMKERALLLGGCFTIETQPGFGTRLIAELPTGDQDQERL